MSSPIDGPAPTVSFTLGLDWLKYRRRTWAAALATLLWPLWSAISGFLQQPETMPARFASWAKNVPLIHRILHDEKLHSGLIGDINNYMLYGGQAVIVLVLLVLSYECLKSKPYYDRGSEKDRLAYIAARRFYVFWICIVLSWLLLYSVRCFYADPDPAHTAGILRNLVYLRADNQFHAIIDILNNLEAVFFFAAYIEMAAITIDDQGQANHITLLVHYLGVASVYIVISGLGLIFPSEGWHILSGLLVGVSMALLIGRFASLYIGTPLPCIVILYFYAVLQATYPAIFDATDYMTEIMNVILVPLKIVMFVVVDWIYFSGKLVFYMGRERRILNQIRADWLKYCSDVQSAKQVSIYGEDRVSLLAEK